MTKDMQNPSCKWQDVIGPWNEEPNRELWEDSKSGYFCLARRNEMTGSWCGYVGIPKTHPVFGLSYGEDSFPDLDVHGGVTYTAACDGDPNSGICHPNDTHEDAWWIGFDCAHYGDLIPSFTCLDSGHYFDSVFKSKSVINYRDLAYVKAECERLAAQLVERSSK